MASIWRQVPGMYIPGRRLSASDGPGCQLPTHTHPPPATPHALDTHSPLPFPLEQLLPASPRLNVPSGYSPEMAIPEC
jgi:hypothetical protein